MSDPRSDAPRIVAITGGDDWADASVDHLIVDRDVDLDAEKAAWHEWYCAVYVPGRKASPVVPYMSLTAKLIADGKARLATDEVEVWHDGY